MNLNLQHAVFHIEKIRNVVNVGRLSPHQIYLVPGNVVGRLGNTVIAPEQAAANDTNYEPPLTAKTEKSSSTSWITRTLAVLQS